MTDKSKKKLQSRRWWIVVWAMLYVTGMTWYGIKSNNTSAWAVIAVVAGIIVSYMTITSLKKKKEEE